MTNLMAAMPFPGHPPSDDVYWLCEFMRDTAALDALVELNGKQKNPAPALRFAPSVAVEKARAEAHKSLIYTIDFGDLLFAHATSTRLTRPVTGAAA